MKRISVRMVRKFDPCYEPTTVKGIDSKTKMTLLEAMSLRIDNADKVWLFSKFATEKQCRIFAIWCARRCQNKKTKPLIDVIEGYCIKGTHTKEEMKKALASAWASASYSASALAWTLALASASAWASAKERQAQVRKIKECLKRKRYKETARRSTVRI